MAYKRQTGQSWSCLTCGALVDNTTLHDSWHQYLSDKFKILISEIETHDAS